MSLLIGLLGRQRPDATFRQHCLQMQMTQRPGSVDVIKVSPSLLLLYVAVSSSVISAALRSLHLTVTMMHNKIETVTETRMIQTRNIPTTNVAK